MEDKPIILIVDDVPSNVQALAILLKDDYLIKVATSGQRALELVYQAPLPDLILLDVEMPDMNGYDVCKHLKVLEGLMDIPVIFVTAKDNEVDEEYGLELGAVDYIIKPFRPGIVKARVKTHIMLKKQHDRLALIALKDQLTGIYNRHYLVDEGKARFSRALRHHEEMSAVIIDIDYFKAINDTFGHLAGDIVLREIAQLLEKNKRKEDLVARFGGEEFVLIMDQCSAEHARIKAEELREKIEGSSIDGMKVTASFGIAEKNEKSDSFEKILKQADEALYKAKENGRNQVCVFGE